MGGATCIVRVKLKDTYRYIFGMSFVTSNTILIGQQQEQTSCRQQLTGLEASTCTVDHCLESLWKQSTCNLTSNYLTMFCNNNYLIKVMLYSTDSQVFSLSVQT